MTRSSPAELCPEKDIAALLEAAGVDAARGLRALEPLERRYPADARLHFLKGSLLAAQRNYTAAREAMRMAVDLAPDYAIARFQLGFLALTNGDPYAAQEVWGPLHALPERHYLRLFVEGLCHLIRDEFDATIRALEEGIALNHENTPLNGDMRLLIGEIRREEDDRSPDKHVESPVGMLLRQSALKTRKN
jgi:tetratricopeptide (TPR) repeat protein